MTKNRNKNIILTVLLGLALVLSLWTASAAVSYTVANGTNVTDISVTNNEAIANITDQINVTFEIGNDTLETWKVNVTSIVTSSYNTTITSPGWINLSVNDSVSTNYASFNNTSFINGTNGATHVLLLNSTQSTYPYTFNVTIENVNNSLENVTITGLSFKAGPPVASGISFINDTSAVANNTDTQDMKVLVKDAFGNPIANRAVTLSSNRTEDTITQTSVTTDAYGNASFTVKSTLAGTANITAAITDTMTTNQTQEVMFVAGPAYKLAWFGDTNSAPGVGSIVPYIAVQDANGNNVTWDTLNADDPYSLSVLMLSGHAEVTSDHPLIVDENNVSNLTANGVNYSSTSTASFTVNNTYDETITMKVTSNRTLLSAETSLTYFGTVESLDVNVNKTSMFADDADSVLVTVQLKDASGANVVSDGVSITLGADNPTLFGGLGVSNDTVDGVATFVVTSTTVSGSDEIDANTDLGKFGSSTLVTISPALDYGTTTVTNTSSTIVAGGNSVITATLVDKAGGSIGAGYSVTFNMTTASVNGTFADDTLLYTTTTDANGNATATVTSTNVSATLTVNVTADDAYGVEQRLDNLQNFDVTPNVVSLIAVSPTSAGLKNEIGTPQPFTLQLTDVHGNNNSTSTTILVTTNNEDLGLINNGTNYTNNVIVTTDMNGAASFTYYVNSSTAGTATLTLNATSYAGVVQPVTIATTDPTGITLVFDALYPATGTTVNATATLTNDAGDTLAISGKILTFTTRNAAGTLLNYTEIPTVDGQAIYDISQTNAGVYTVAVANATMGLSATNTTTFVGAPTSVVAAVNDSNVLVNDTVAVNATIKDINGFTTSALNTETIRFMIDSVTIDTATITNGVASTTYTTANAGPVTILAFYNETLQDTVDVTFTEPAAAEPSAVINEFISNPGLDFISDRIELYNPTSTAIDLTGWTIVDNSASVASLDGLSIPANGYLELEEAEQFSFALASAGDIITLKNGATVIDQVAYGDYDDGNVADNAPAPGEAESVGRSPNGVDTGVDSADFAVFTTPTLGASNTGTPALVCSVTPNSRAAQVGTPVTILMSVINYGTGTATGVSISQASSLAASVSYRPWDGVSAYTGPVDTPVDIAAGATANFVLIINATSAFPSSAMTFDVSGTNVAAAPVSGVNTLTLFASPVPSADVIMISTDTTVTSAVDAAKAFAVATTNVGNADATGVSFVVDVPAGITGLVYQVNETNLDGSIKGPATGLTIAIGDQPTFAVFVTATEAIVNDPTNNRITLKLVDVSGNVIGAQSIGIYTT